MAAGKEEIEVVGVGKAKELEYKKRKNNLEAATKLEDRKRKIDFEAANKEREIE